MAIPNQLPPSPGLFILHSLLFFLLLLPFFLGGWEVAGWNNFQLDESRFPNFRIKLLHQSHEHYIKIILLSISVLGVHYKPLSVENDCLVANPRSLQIIPALAELCKACPAKACIFQCQHKAKITQGRKHDMFHFQSTK